MALISATLKPSRSAWGGDEEPIRRRQGQRRLDLRPRRAVERLDAVEAGQARFEAAQRLLQALVDVAADPHHLAHRLHRVESRFDEPLNFSKVKRGILVTT
jgi:hypothetical protein